MMTQLKSPLILTAILLLIVGLGTRGYMIIEGWNFHDSLYMTMITLTTVGYREVRSLSLMGRYFTVFLLALSFGVGAYLVTAIMSGIMSNFSHREERKMQRKLRYLENHTIILGFGRMGRRICKELADAKLKFVVMEKAKHHVDELRKTPYLWIEGDAADDTHLQRCNIAKARSLVCVIDNDADGLYTALAARSLNKDLYIIIRAESESSRKKILMAGADKVVLPYTLSAQKIAQSIIDPQVEDIMAVTSGIKGQYQTELKIMDISINEDSDLKGKPLHACGFAKEDMMVIGIKKKDQPFQFSPSQETCVQSGDTVVVLFPDAATMGLY